MRDLLLRSGDARDTPSARSVPQEFERPARTGRSKCNRSIRATDSVQAEMAPSPPPAPLRNNRLSVGSSQRAPQRLSHWRRRFSHTIALEPGTRNMLSVDVGANRAV